MQQGTTVLLPSNVINWSYIQPATQRNFPKPLSLVNMPAHQNANMFHVQYMCAGARARRCWPSDPLFTPAAIYLLFILPFGTKAAPLALLLVKTHPFPVIPGTLLPVIPPINPLVPFPGNPSISFTSSTSQKITTHVIFSPVLWSQLILQLGCCLLWRSSFTLC